MAHILLLTKGTAGDLVPFLEIGRVARERGHRVTLLTHAPYAEAASRAGLGFVPLDSAQAFEQFVQDGPLLNQPRSTLVFFRRHLLPRVRREYEALLDRGGTTDTVLVARHMASLSDLMFAETARVPVVRLFTAASQVTTFGLVEALFQQVCADEVNDVRVALGLAPIRDWHAWFAMPTCNVGGWPSWFGPTDSDGGPRVQAVGFLQHDDSETGALPAAACALLHDREPRPVVISGGTGISLSAAFYAAAAEACRLLARPALLVTRHRNLVPDPLPEGVAWFPSLPFASVLPRVAAVIHHGGVGTLARSMAAGIPQLVMPLGSDRPDNAERVRALGVGDVVLPCDWHAERIAERLHRLLQSREVHAHCRALAQRLASSAPPGAVACDAIEAALAHQP